MKKTTGILILFFFILHYGLKANQVDSLLNILNQAPYDTGRVDTYIKLFELYCISDSAKAYRYFEDAVDLAEKLKYTYGIANAYYKYGCYNADIANFEKSVFFCEKAIQLYKHLENSNIDEVSVLSKKGLAECYNNIGIVHSDKGNYPQAIEFYQKAAKIYEYLGNMPDLIIANLCKKGLATCYNNIGIVHTYLHNYSNAIDYHQKAILLKEELGDKKGIAVSYGNIGVVYDDQGYYTLAIEYYQKSLNIQKELGIKKGMSFAYFNIGEVYADQGLYNKAIDNYNESLKLSNEIGDKKTVSSIYSNLATLYIKIKDYTQALKNAQKSLQIANEIKILHWQRNAYENLSEANAGLGNYEEAFRYQKLFKKFNDSIFNEESSKQLKEMEVRYQTEKKEQEINELKQKEEIQNLQLKKSTVQRKFLLVITLLTLIIIFVFYSRYRYKIKTTKILEKKNNQLEVLNNMKDRLFSIIAHDLKNPLSSFRNITKSLIENIQVINKSQVKYFINEINNSADKLYNLMQNLLTWALSQTGSIKSNPKIINMKEMVNNSFNLLKSNAQIKNIQLFSEINENVYVYADEVMVYSILGNLLTNAIKFTNDNGKVTVSYIERARYFEFRIIDSGIGIKREDIDKLFLLDTNYKEIGDSSEKGTGLGLMLCKELVEKNKGEIHTESELGQGSTFIFTLPKYNK